ncbi:hypothetical protein BU17DRAFT_63774 [Hysterangium stoloniferum]|nr:hypothetical protein BU17DRAFT_63774 [Hysterangium stoloniferum]
MVKVFFSTEISDLLIADVFVQYSSTAAIVVMVYDYGTSMALGALASIFVMTLEIPPGQYLYDKKDMAIQNYRDEYRVPMLSGMIRDRYARTLPRGRGPLSAFFNLCCQYFRNHVQVQITIVPIGDYAFQMDKYHIVHDGISPDFNRFDRLSAHQSGGQMTTDLTRG